MTGQYSISEVAVKAGLSVHQVRVYMQLGLVAPCKLTSAGYRVFDDGCIGRLRLIRSAMQSGLQLRDLVDFMQALDHSDAKALKRQQEVLCTLLASRRKHLNTCRSLLKRLSRQVSTSVVAA